jgi:hypothetical protein
MTLYRNGVHITAELHRLDRRIASTNTAIAALRKGPFFRLTLSDDRAVSADVAEILTNHALVAPAGGALFDGKPGQTWRFTNV